MGIRNLIPRLRHKADDSVWAGTNSSNADLQEQATRSKIAIIDGPSLAYHIYNQDPERFAVRGNELLVDYQHVADSYVSFLQDLESRGFTIERVYFDGLLPLPKRPTRIARVEDNVRRVVAIREAVAAQDARGDAASAAECHQKLARASKHHHFQPSFLVPAAIECLSKTRYTEHLNVVAGEADHFCTARAGDLLDEEPSRLVFIFSSDSDLLIHDAKKNTYIALLSNASSIEVYYPVGIAASLGQASLMRIGFEMQEDTHMTLTAAAIACTRELSTEHRQRWETFIEAQTPTLMRPTGMLGAQWSYLSRMDPRVSELIHDVRAFSTKHSMRQESQIWPYPTIFLPHLLEDTRKSSTWIPSRHIRSLAYAVLAQKEAVDVINEADRRGNKSVISTIEVEKDPSGMLSSYIDWLTENVDAIRAAGLPAVWRILSMISLISSIRADEKQVPSLEDIMSVLSADRYASWGTVHLSAELTAMMYSYRILRLAVGFIVTALRLYNNGRTKVEDLDDILVDMPPLASICNGISGEQRPRVEDYLRQHPAMKDVVASSDVESLRSNGGIRSSSRKRQRETALKTSPRSTAIPKKSRKQSNALVNNPFHLLEDE